MHFALFTLSTMSTLFEPKLVSLENMTPTDKMSRLARVISMHDAEALLLEAGRNINSYCGFVGFGDSGRPFASSLYVHRKQYSEHGCFIPLREGEGFRDPPTFINVSEGHSSQQLPTENSTLEAYEALRKIYLQLEQQEYSQRHGGKVCFPAD